MEGALRDPGIPDGETTTYHGLIDGRPVAAGRMTVARVDDERPAYRLGMAFTVRDEAHYELALDFQRSRGTVVAEHYRLETRHGEQPVAVEEGWFRDVQTLQFGGRLKPYPRSTMPLLGCALGLRGMDFTRGSRSSFPLWLANTVYWQISTHVERAEEVTVPAGSLEAWRVRVRPSFEAINRQLDRVIGLFLPPFVLHFERAAPHRMLRFEFPTGPFPWDPRAVVEATTLD